MQLGSYLKREGISLADFARRIGVANASVVQRYVIGARIPRRVPMSAILRETRGEVQANDFVGAPAEADSLSPAEA